jgi:hypothetical protein
MHTSTLTTRLLQLTFLALLIACALGINYLAAWTGPSTAAPGNNVDAPLNVSTTAQSKEGAFALFDNFYAQGIGVNVSPPTHSLTLGPTANGITTGIKFADGTVQTTAGGSQGLSFDEYLHIQHRPGASYTVSAGWNVRALNTTITNTITGASLSSNRITLPAGTYYIQANANAYSAHTIQSAIYNVTGGTYILYGVVGWGNGGSSDQGGDSSVVSGLFTLGSQSQIEVRLGAYENGLCYRTDVLIPGGSESNHVCTDVEIWKLD